MSVHSLQDFQPPETVAIAATAIACLPDFDAVYAESLAFNWRAGAARIADATDADEVASAARHGRKMMAFLHPAGSTGAPSVCDAGFTRHCSISAKNAASPDGLDGVTHVSLQRFKGRRGSARLAAINVAAWADTELGPTSPFHGMDKREVAGILIERHRDAGRTPPNVILDSGEGMWALWVVPEMPASAWPRVKSVQRHHLGPVTRLDGTFSHSRHARKDARVRACEAKSAAIWAGFNLDHGVSDPARIMRLAGTINEGSGTRVRLLWPASWEECERVDFEDLARSVEPYSRDEVRAYRAARAERIESARDATSRPVMNSPGKWSAIEADLMTVIRARGTDGLRHSKVRNYLAYNVAVARAQSGMGGDAASWARELAPLVGLPVARLTKYLGSVSRRLRRHEAGEVREWNGRTWTWLYSPSVRKIVDQIDLNEDLARDLGLAILKPVGMAKTDAQRQAEKRRRAGRLTRADIATAGATMGATAVSMIEAGLTVTDVAAAYGVARGTIYKAMKAASEEAPAILASEETEMTVQDASRQLNGLACSAPAPAPVTVEPPAKVRKIAPCGPAQGSKAKPAPPSWPSYDPTERLYALAEHLRRESRLNGAGDNPRAAFAEAREMLAIELETGSRFSHVNFCPDRQRGLYTSSPWHPRPVRTCSSSGPTLN